MAVIIVTVSFLTSAIISNQRYSADSVDCLKNRSLATVQAHSAKINSGPTHIYVPELPNALWQRPPRALAAILLNPIANTRRLGMAGEANSDPARCPCLFGGSENIRGNSRRYRLQEWTIAADGNQPAGDENIGLKRES
jgi:hypothetical protein